MQNGQLRFVVACLCLCVFDSACVCSLACVRLFLYVVCFCMCVSCVCEFVSVLLCVCGLRARVRDCVCVCMVASCTLWSSSEACVCALCGLVCLFVGPHAHALVTVFVCMHVLVRVCACGSCMFVCG